MLVCWSSFWQLSWVSLFTQWDCEHQGVPSPFFPVSSVAMSTWAWAPPQPTLFIHQFRELPQPPVALALPGLAFPPYHGQLSFLISRHPISVLVSEDQVVPLPLLLGNHHGNQQVFLGIHFGLKNPQLSRFGNSTSEILGLLNSEGLLPTD